MPSDPSVWSTGFLAREWLGQGAPQARVAHLFPNSFYVNTSNGELVNFTRKEVRSPVNVNVRGGPDFQEALKVGDKVNAGDGVLEVGSLSFAVGGGVFRNADIAATADVGRFKKLGGTIISAATLLQVMGIKEGMLDPSAKAFGSYSSFLRGAFMQPRRLDEAAFHDGALKLLGLGSGFTPSFDDFLSGYLCVFNLGRRLANSGPLLFERQLLEERTSWASARLLDYMQKGLMDEEVERVSVALFGGEGERFLLSLEDLVGRGHSSGLDISVGIIMASSVLISADSGMDLPSRVVSAMGL